MNFTSVLLAILLPLAWAASLGEQPIESWSEDEPIPVFVQTLQDLHRAPPISLNKNVRANVKTRWISQKLDNFDKTNNKTWLNRYMINEDYFVNGSPIFFYLGGEWEISPGPISQGHWVDIAREHNGSLVYTEHRFFGQSIPITPLTTANLKYQSVYQSLADLNNTITVLKQQDKYKSSKVVLSGCSYSASMVTWFRHLYPNVTVGGWASSGPLVAKVNFPGYMETVGTAYFQLGTPDCYDIIENATFFYEELFENGRGAEAKKLLNLCDNFDVDDKKDRWQLFSSIANIFGGIAQTQGPGDLWAYCTVLQEFDPLDDAKALSQFIQWRLKYPTCVSIKYTSTVNWYKWSMYNYDGSGLGWYYQTCSEFGWYQSSDGNYQPFGSSFPATLYTDICYDVFSTNYTAAKIEANVAKTNVELGGLKPNVTNVYYTQGGLDPWHTIGAGVEQGATIIPYASHCEDMDSISDKDSVAMKASKLRLAKLVREWLA